MEETDLKGEKVEVEAEIEVKVKVEVEGSKCEKLHAFSINFELLV